jgi:RNA polymerase sigma factor (sigma-70 family)
MTPPAAEELVPRLFLGPALRTQSDRRLVRLVRDGYEAAFDEIVRRYGRQLRRYAGAIVGARAEDVTQDAFFKALLALRRDRGEIDLRPWLYRIVRNTALNDLRDRPPAAVALAETIEGRVGVVEELEQREEVAELVNRLRALPEPQRAAIVMRELEGLGHEEIAAALGVSDGAARQAIHRARTALRNGVGMAVPLPLVRAMLEGGAAQPIEIATGGAGAGLALKAATATVLVAGTFGAGVALHEREGAERPRDGSGKASVTAQPDSRGGSKGTLASSAAPGDRHQGSGRGHGPSGDGGPSRGPDGEHRSGPSFSSSSGPSGAHGPGPDGRDDSSGPGQGGGGTSGGGEGFEHGGPGPSSGSGSGLDGDGGSGSGEAFDSNSAPDSGGSESLPGLSSSESSDPHGSDGLWEGTQPQP